MQEGAVVGRSAGGTEFKDTFAVVASLIHLRHVKRFMFRSICPPPIHVRNKKKNGEERPAQRNNQWLGGLGRQSVFPYLLQK